MNSGFWLDTTKERVTALRMNPSNHLQRSHSSYSSLDIFRHMKGQAVSWRTDLSIVFTWRLWYILSQYSCTESWYFLYSIKQVAIDLGRWGLSLLFKSVDRALQSPSTGSLNMFFLKCFQGFRVKRPLTEERSKQNVHRGVSARNIHLL